MATLTNKRGVRIIQFPNATGGRETLYLGRLPEMAAWQAKSHVENLIAARETATELPEETRQWVRSIGDDLRAKLISKRLLDDRGMGPAPAIQRLVATEDRRRERFTYFVQREDGGPIKIGKTCDIRSRLSGLQSGSPMTLVCIGYVDGDREDELHERFHDLCLCGEWFRPAEPLLGFIRKKATPAHISVPPLLPAMVKIKRDLRKYGYTTVPVEDL